jgi:hypothetical protein
MDAFPLTQSSISGEKFLAAALPALQSCDAAALAKAVSARWSPSQVCQLLRHANVDVRRVATVTMGMIGNMGHVTCLTHALSDGDPQVNQMAEHALWSIWFRSGSPQAAQPFREGLSLLSAELYAEAKEKFLEAAAIDPFFAEAHNQCGIACYLDGDYDGSIKACKKAIKLVPLHFGAISGMGHSFAQMGELNLALRCYRRARKINPQLEGINDAINRLQTKITDMSDSGFFELDAIAQ